MAWAKGRQAASETAKAECLRRYGRLMLKCEARYYNGRLEGFVVTWDDLSYGGKRFIAGAKSASEAWREALSKLVKLEKFLR